MSKISRFSIMLVFISYWLITVVFTFPENFINISLDRGNQIFQLFFFQRWAFFAPPPNFDERVYFTYIDRSSGLSKTYEIIETINEEKSKKAPFNTKEDILDYIISNSVNGIQEMMYEMQEVHKHEEDIESPSDSKDINRKHFIDSTYLTMINEVIPKTDYFKTLKNYSIVIAEKKGIRVKDCKVVIAMSRRLIPKFVDRFSVEKRKEEIFFESQPLNY